MATDILDGLNGSSAVLGTFIKQKVRDARAVVVTGHSLGGATSMAIAWRLASKGLIPANTPLFNVTFGGPRLFQREGVAAYDAKLLNNTFRFVFNKDPIPHVPMNAEKDGLKSWTQTSMEYAESTRA